MCALHSHRFYRCLKRKRGIVCCTHRFYRCHEQVHGNARDIFGGQILIGYKPAQKGWCVPDFASVQCLHFLHKQTWSQNRAVRPWSHNFPHNLAAVLISQSQWTMRPNTTWNILMRAQLIVTEPSEEKDSLVLVFDAQSWTLRVKEKLIKS